LVLGYAKLRSGFALLSTFDEEGRQFGLTTDLAVIPMDRTRAVQPSRFSGLHLTDEVTLPVAFVRSRHAVRSEKGPAGALLPGRPLGWREAVPMAGTSRTLGGVTYLPATDGSYVRADQVVKVNAIRRMPAWASEGRKWIDISILQQSLVAYEGTKPVFVTLVSTGADGLGDPKKTHSTVQGAFLIHTKHITVTMDGDEDTDRFDFRDVPFVQYFTEGYALHGAYWHDDFGTPRSHGCVNLSPADAAWLFGWTDPKVPANWHASLVLRKGTLVHIHP
jgi:lipoprotein-anchoring transpeptidase ErfK/SrfK